jgi:hypothetical protein
MELLPLPTSQILTLLAETTIFMIFGGFILAYPQESATYLKCLIATTREWYMHKFQCVTRKSLIALGVAGLWFAWPLVARTAEHISNASFYPNGNVMLFSMYSLVEPELSRARADGLTAVGPYYGDPDLDKAIATAASAELPLIYTAGWRLDFDATPNPNLDVELERLATAVADASASPQIAAWALANEELRFWRKAEMLWLENATRVIRDNDPANRPILMYEPNNRNSDGLEKTSQYLDFAAKGAYANHVGMTHKRTWVRWSVEQAVIAAAKTDTVPIAFLWMAKDQENTEDEASIGRWAKHDVYLSLITGAKGIIVWSGWNRRAGFQKDFADFYDGYVTAATELNGELQLARVFLFGEAKLDISISVVTGPTTQSFDYQDNHYEYPTISSAQLELDSKNYLFVVNSAEQAVTIEVNDLPGDKQIINAFTGATYAPEAVTALDKYEVLALAW